MSQLSDIVHVLMAEGKGIIALDEGPKTVEKRLSVFGITSTEDSRRDFRELFISTKGAEEYLSGAILHDETIRQSSRAGVPIPDIMKSKNILVGIKVDEGLEPLAGDSREQVTKGIEHLAGKLNEYKELGAVFTKWRAVIEIDGNALPSEKDIDVNTDRLAEYARITQEHGLVPLVEPEVLLSGFHARLRAEEVMIETYKELFADMKAEGVDMSGIILKSSMALSGKETGVDEPDDVAESTLRVFRESVPHDIGGIVFLSGGQTPDQATRNLAAIMKRGPHPWKISFSYARALQEEALHIWGGHGNRFHEAQAVFMNRLKKVASALGGTIE